MNTIALMAALAGTVYAKGTLLPDQPRQRPYQHKPLSNRERKLQEKPAKKRRAAK